LAGSLLLGAGVVASVIVGSAPASATTVSLYVAVGGAGNCTSHANACGSIQAAIDIAEDGDYNSDDVTINVAAGTYTEDDTIDASLLNSLTIAGAGSIATKVDGNNSGSGSVFVIANGTVTFSDIAIDNGDATDVYPRNGGGIDACDGLHGSVGGDDCVLTVTNSSFSNDVASSEESYGGAIAIANFGGGTGSLAVSDSSFTDDAAASSGRGGAIGICNGDTGCNLTVTGSTFTGNYAFYGGGAIYSAGNPYDNWVSSTGTVSVTDSTFTDNGSVVGGAITSGEGVGAVGTVNVTESTFSGNMAGMGGGIDNGDQGGSGGVTVTDSTFSDNEVGSGAYWNEGGAIANAVRGGGTLTVDDSTFVGNTIDGGGASAGVGGAIDNGDGGGSGMAKVTDSTFADNSAVDGGAIDNGGGTVDLGADILSAASMGGECSGAVTDEGYNIANDASCGFSATGSINSSGTLDASLGALDYNGGPTQTILPMAGPAVSVIPTGTTLNAVSVCPRTDQRGVTSVGNCTIGAVEGVAPPTATISSPATGGTYAQGENVHTSFHCREGTGGPGLSSCDDNNGTTITSAPFTGLSGTLNTSAVRTFTYTVTATSTDGLSQVASISYTVAASPTATISSPATGGTYDQGQVVHTTFSCSEGAGGSGLSSCDDNNGKNTTSGGSGTLDTSTTGPHTYTVTATSSDALSGSAMISYSVVPALTILTTSVPAASEGVSYSTPLSAADGTGADTWSQPGGGLPTGMSLSPGGVLSGTPTGCSAIVGQCPYTFTVQVTDSANYSVQQTLTLVLTNEGSGGGPPPPPPTPPASTTVGCAGGASCSGTVGTSADVYQLSGTPTGPGSLSLSTETATLDCGNGYDQTGTILDETSKGPFPYVTVVETIYNVSGASAYRVCYEDPTPFRDLAGATVTIGLLPHCSAKIAPPCVVSQRNVLGNVVVSSNLPVGDPKVHAEKKTHPKVHIPG
jgi:hypothetical protein